MTVAPIPRVIPAPVAWVERAAECGLMAPGPRAWVIRFEGYIRGYFDQMQKCKLLETLEGPFRKANLIRINLLSFLWPPHCPPPHDVPAFFGLEGP